MDPSDRSSQFPPRQTFVSMSYNLWGDHQLAERTPALRSLLELRDPDILTVQELKPASRELIDQALPGHRRVEDDFPGWAVQGNIWWRDGLFELEEHGAEEVGIRSRHARLFWARLRLPAGVDQAPALLFATAHLTWQGHPREREDDVNPRVGQARQIVSALDRLAPDTPCVFTVDINDIARPVWALREAGFQDSFAALGRHSPVTHPVTPLSEPEHPWSTPAVPKVLDWQFHRGPIRPRCTEVVEFFFEGRAPSDHKPVVVTYTTP